jgi:hypothetical protein
MSRMDLLRSRAELKQKYGEIVSDLNDKKLENIFNDILLYGNVDALKGFDLMVRANAYISTYNDSESENTKEAVENILNNFTDDDQGYTWNEEERTRVFNNEIDNMLNDLYITADDINADDINADDSEVSDLDINIINDFIEKLSFPNLRPDIEAPYDLKEANKDVKNTNLFFELLEKKKKKTLPKELVEAIKDYHDPDHITESRKAMKKRRKNKTKNKKNTEEEPGGGGYTRGRGKKKGKKKATKKRSRK